MDNAPASIEHNEVINPFERLTLWRLVVWEAVGVLFFLCVCDLVVDFTSLRFSPYSVAIAWRLVLYIPVLLWLLLESDLGWADIRRLVGTRSGNTGWSRYVLWPMAAATLCWSYAVVGNHMRSWFFPVSIEQVSSDPDTTILGLAAAGGSSMSVTLAGVGIVGVLGPVLEELVFRGIIINRVATKTNIFTAILLSSILFAACHASNCAGAFVFGVFMALLYIRTRSLVAPIACHVLVNTSAFILLCLVQSPSMGPQALDTVAPLMMSLFSVVTATICSVLWLVGLSYYLYREWRNRSSVIPYLANLSDF